MISLDTFIGMIISVQAYTQVVSVDTYIISFTKIKILSDIQYYQYNTKFMSVKFLYLPAPAAEDMGIIPTLHLEALLVTRVIVVQARRREGLVDDVCSHRESVSCTSTENFHLL